MEKNITDEQVLDTSTQNEVIEEVEVDETETVDDEVKGNDDIDKLIQSASSKAKNEILKEIGINSVDEIKALIGKGKEFDEVNTKYATLTEEYEGAVGKVKQYEDELLVTKLGVNPAIKDEFLMLVNADTSGDDKVEVAQRLKEKFDSVGIGAKPNQVKLGGDKTPDEGPATLEEQLKELRRL